jgi:PQQ-dependent catabolism-associated beta-propeller protein
MTIFVSNEKDNTITVIDGDTLEIKNTIKVSRRPRGIVLSPDYKELFVAAGDGDIMDVVDTATMQVTRQLEPDPELMAVDSKGEIIYIANEDDSLVTIMDIKSGEVLGEVPVGVEPEGMIVSPDDRYTAATSESTSMAHIIDNKTRQLVHSILVDSRPREAKFTADKKELWVSSEVGGTISVIDTSNWDDPKSWKVIKEIGFEVPGVRPELLQPVGMDFSKDGKLLFSPLGPANRVAVIDTATKEVKDYILVGQRPWHGELGPDGKKYYVANGLTNDMTVIDVESLKAEKSVPVGRLPWGVAIMP